MTVLAVANEHETTDGGGLCNDSSSTSRANSPSDFYSFNTRGTEYVPMKWGTSRTDIWLHSHLYIDQATAGNAAYPIEFVDETSGNVQIAFRGNDDSPLTFGVYVDSGLGLTQVGSDFQVATKTEIDIDIKIVVHATNGEIRYYQNGVEIFSYVGNTSTINGSFDRILLKNYSTYTVFGMYWSQIILADEPTIGWFLDTLRATSDDSLGTWSGTYVDIDEEDFQTETDIISSDTVGDEALFAHSGIDSGVSSATYEVKALCVGSASALQASSTPGDARHIVKTGATVYESADLGLTPDGSTHTNATFWETNPNTTSSWTFAEINAMTFGIKNIA